MSNTDDNAKAEEEICEQTLHRLQEHADVMGITLQSALYDVTPDTRKRLIDYMARVALDNAAIAIKTAPNLYALLSALRAFDAACDDDTDQENEMISRGVSMKELPTFGGHEPDQTMGIWSWDKDNLLVGDTIAEMQIFTREEWDSF